LINNLPLTENGLIDILENRPNEQLVHRFGKWQHISSKEIEDIAITKYQNCGLGITFNDITTTFQCKKTKAQKKLKFLCNESSNKNGERVKPKLFTINRTKPQQYFPKCIRATIIENTRNRLIDPTGVTYSNQRHSSTYPLHNTIETQIVQSFLLQLYLLPFQPLNMHNIHLWTIIHKSHYEELKLKPAFNKTKIVRERIGLREVICKFNKKGSIEIDITCSKYPFQIETDDDVNNFFVFLGKVQYTLAYILSDPREIIVPSADKWILKSCDFNKDIEIKEIGQLLDLNIQVKHAGKAFRLYVKNLEDRFVLRGEQTMKVNQPISIFLDDAILNPFHLINSKVNELINIVDKKTS
jgi:hypothetical protein